MDLRIDNYARRKLFLSKDAERYFVFEFPVDADMAELYGVTTGLKQKLWDLIEEQKKKDDTPKEDQAPVPEVVEEVKE